MITDTQIFLDRLNVAKVGLAKKEIVETTGSYIFDHGQMFTINDSIAITSWVPVNNVNGALNAESLYPIIKESMDSHITIRCVDSTLLIDGNETNAKIPINDASDILSYIHSIGVPPINSTKWAPLATNFTPQLKSSQITVSKNMARPILTCVHWNNDVLESTDNRSLTRCTLAATHPEAERILIPSEAVAALLKFDPIAFAWTGEWLHFKTKQDALVSVRTFDGVFPDLGQCLSKENSTFIEFPPNFSAALKRACKIIPRDRYRQKEAKVSICKGTLTIQVKAGQEGEFQESCPVSADDTLIFKVDPDRLQQFLKENGNHVAGFAEFKATSGLLTFETDNVVRQLLVTLV